MVLIVGGTTLDFIIKKEPIKKAMKIELRDDELFLNIGGGGSNAAYILSKLGTNVYFLTKFGNDFIAHVFENFFKTANIKLIKTKKEGKSSISFIFDFGDRIIYTFRGSLNHLKEQDILEPLPNYEWLYITSNKGETIKLISKLIKQSKKYNKKIFVNPSLYSVIALKKEILNSDLVILNKEEAFELTNTNDLKEALDILNYKNEKIEKIGIITDGKNGVYFKKLGKYYHLNIEKAAKKLNIKVIDTTGAGDCFSATFFHFFITRKKPFIDSLILATLNSFNIIQRIGTKHSLTEGELLDKLDKFRYLFKIEELT